MPPGAGPPQVSNTTSTLYDQDTDASTLAGADASEAGRDAGPGAGMDTGCGCGATGSGTAGPLVIVLGLAFLGRRRR